MASFGKFWQVLVSFGQPKVWQVFVSVVKFCEVLVSIGKYWQVLASFGQRKGPSGKKLKGTEEVCSRVRFLLCSQKSLFRCIVPMNFAFAMCTKVAAFKIAQSKGYPGLAKNVITFSAKWDRWFQN